MSEFYDLFWGTTETNRDLDIFVETTDTPLSRIVALESFRSLVRSRPDAGSLRSDDEFLMQFLTARKMIVPDAMAAYDNYYRFVRRHSELISGNIIDNPEVRQALEDGLPGVLQHRDRRGRRIMVLFAAEWDPSRYSIPTIQKAIHMSLDLLLQDCVVQERGLILIIDWSQFSFQQWYVEAAISLLKAFLRETSRTKIFSHGHNLSSLHQILSREILPTELGGEQGPYQSSIWIDNLERAKF